MGGQFWYTIPWSLWQQRKPCLKHLVEKKILMKHGVDYEIASCFNLFSIKLPSQFSNKKACKRINNWIRNKKNEINIKTDFISKHKAIDVHKRSETEILQPLITLSLIVSHAEAKLYSEYYISFILIFMIIHKWFRYKIKLIINWLNICPKN